jgi:hypothetical protein
MTRIGATVVLMECELSSTSTSYSFFQSRLVFETHQTAF